MGRIVLHAPAISPTLEDVKRALFIGDQFGSILPYNDIYHSEVDPELKELYDMGYYRPFIAERILEKKNTIYYKFKEDYLKILDSKIFDPYKKNWFRKSNLAVDLRDYPLYIGKFSSDILTELKDRNLYIPKNGKRGDFHQVAGKIYMSMLADYCVEQENNEIDTGSYIIPATDQSLNIRWTYQSGEKKEKGLHMFYHNCMPVLAPSMTIADIVDFKNNQPNELIEFKKFIDATVNIFRGLAEKGDNNELQRVAQEFKRNIVSSVGSLERSMSLTRWQFVWEGFSSFTSVKTDIPKALAETGLLGAKVAPATTAGITLGIAAILVGKTYFTSRMSQKKTLAEHPLAYLYHAKKKGIIADLS